MTKKSQSSSQQASVGTSCNLQWTNEMDSVLLDAMLEEKQRGNRVDGTWTTAAYDNMVRVLRESVGPMIVKENVKNRNKTHKKLFSECKDLFDGLSGFAWSPVTKKFEAPSEVWMQLIQAKPSARKWLNHPMHNYDKLYDIYWRDRATGEHAESAREKLQRWQRERTSTNFDLNLDDSSLFGDDVNLGQPPTENIGAENSFNSTVHPSNDSQAATSSKGTKRKAPMVDLLENQIEMSAHSMKEVDDVIRDGNNMMERSLATLNQIAERSLEILERSRPRCYHEDEIFNALKEIEVPQNYIVKALRFLLKNEDERRMFFALPVDMRFELLVSQMKMHG